MRLRNLLLAWLLLPLIALWALGYRIVYLRSIDEVNEAYDRTLLGSALAMAERVSVDRGELSVDLPYAALQMLESGAQDRIFYRISSTGDARLATGYADLPPPPALPKSEAPLFYDARYLGEPIRLVALLKPLYDGKDAPLVVQVGETMAAREALARRILIDSAAPQLALIGAAALLVVFGVRRGLEPLRRLRCEVQARGDADLSPIDASGVPREVAPLIEAINLHAERQRQMTEAQRRFIADASHQLKTPLTVLKTQAALALAQNDAQAMRGIVRQIHDSTDVTARVIAQLLALARSEPGLGLAAERADLVEIARSATFDLLPQALKKSVELAFDDDGPAPVDGQPLLLRELVANLVDNAVRYARAGGNVAVSVRRADDASVQLVVEDDGPGIAPAEREKVFERFYRAGGASSEGSGLGLAIVRQIAERHRATIRIDAGAGGAGTRVTVRLPGSTALPGASEVQPGSRSIPWRAAIEPPADRSPTA